MNKRDVQIIILIRKNVQKYPLLGKYFEKVVEKQISRYPNIQSLLEIPYVRYLVKDDIRLKNFEEYLSARSFTNIELPLKRLQNNPDEYLDVLAELQGAVLLHDEGMTDIKFLSQSTSSPDIEYKGTDRETKYAEIKNFMWLNPEFSILQNKLEAKCILNPKFIRDFTITPDYDLLSFNSIERLHTDFRQAVDQLILALEDDLEKDSDFEDANFMFNNIKFKVTTKKGDDSFHLMLFGNLTVYSSPKDIFLDMTSVYSRFIRDFKKGYLQLLSNRSGDNTKVKDDRIYFFLNVEKYKIALKDQVKDIINSLSKSLGMSEMVKIIIEL